MGEVARRLAALVGVLGERAVQYAGTREFLRDLVKRTRGFPTSRFAH